MKAIKINILISTLLSGLIISSCTDYLDVVPDNIPTVDHAFADRHHAEGFLYGCYGFLPDHANPQNNPAFFGGDEAWTMRTIEQSRYFYYTIWPIALGEQGTETPVADYWASTQDGHDLQGGTPIWTGIRDCNIFLENIHLPRDLQEWERDIWMAEIKTLKAYLHFWLFRMYGPIPLIKENIPLSESEIKLYREPVDSVLNYIVELLDEAIINLPLKTEYMVREAGRFTKPAACALKAQVLTYAASPLFNGNTNYSDMIDNRGIQLFPQEYKIEKWQLAAEALKEAIAVCHDAGHRLFYFEQTGLAENVSEETELIMNLRGAVTERWNDEIVWGSTHNTQKIQHICVPRFTSAQSNAANTGILYSPPLRIVEQFYTENGVPIDEDKDWQDVNWYGYRPGDEKHKRYIRQGNNTANINFNREARFYASLMFESSMHYGAGILSDASMNHFGTRAGTGFNGIGRLSGPVTGYLVEKVISRLTGYAPGATSVTYYRYTFPIIRLADLYLMYAEALNESQGPVDEVFEYVDLVRQRSGLNGIIESWADHSLIPEKPNSKEGMREIIRRERMIELAFEGHRFWDLRRWLLAEEYMNKPIRGLNPFENIDIDKYFTVRLVTDQRTTPFEKKDYLWPIRQSVLVKNAYLIQNPGW